jgi:hypothetical protein
MMNFGGTEATTKIPRTEIYGTATFFALQELKAPMLVLGVLQEAILAAQVAAKPI